MKVNEEYETARKRFLEVAMFSEDFHAATGDIFAVAVTLNVAVAAYRADVEYAQAHETMISVMKTCALALNNVGWRKLGPLSERTGELFEVLSREVNK